MRSINRRSALMAAGSFGAGLIASTALGASWMREERQPTLTVLGCRNGLSALLTAGGARLLLLGGTDDADFGNALADARNPLLSRIDLVIVQGQTTPPPLVRSALRAVDARRVYTIGSARELLDAGIHVDRELTVPYQLDLPVETGVMIAPATGTPDSSHSFWSIRLQWRTHQVLIDSGGDVEALPSDILHPTAWIRAAGAFTAEDILDDRTSIAVRCCRGNRWNPDA